MASNISIKITNASQIRAAFHLSPVLMKTELNLAIRKAVLTIQAKSMINTPVDTGRLRSSTQSKFSELRGEVGTHTQYDVFVHNGTKFMTARPYLLNAVEDTNEQINALFILAVNNVLSKIGKAV